MTRRVLWGLSLGAFACFFFSAACGGGRAELAGGQGELTKSKGDRTRVSHSEGVEPLWIQECPARTEHTLPYCGESHRQPSQKMACAEANASAVQKLQRSISQETNADLRPDGKGGYAFSIECAGAEATTLKGVWEDQTWWEEYEGGGGRTFDCHVMLTYPTLEYENLVGMSRKATQDWVAKATALHQEGAQKAASCLHAEAGVLFDRARNILACLKEPLITPSGLNSALLGEQVAADLKNSQEESTKLERTALVVVHLVVDGKAESSGNLFGSMQNTLQSQLSKRGLRIRPGGLSDSEVAAVLSGDQNAAKAAAGKCAGYLVLLDLNSEYLAFEDVHYAVARGSFRLIRTADGRELATADLGPEKQGHPGGRANALKLSVEKLRDKMLEKTVQDAMQKI